MRNKIIDSIHWPDWEDDNGHYKKLTDVLSRKIDDVIQNALLDDEYIETLEMLKHIITSFTEEEIKEKTNNL